MALMYINQSIALAKLLHLGKATIYLDEDIGIYNNTHHLAVEHLRRLWWTALCLERKLATTFGIRFEHTNTSQDIPLPSSNNILPEDMAQFFDPEALLENIQATKV
jgi:hypothetical protein